MAQPPTQDITAQILVQIRDEMREMRTSFEGRFDALEARLESLDSKVEALAARIDSIEKRMDVLEKRMDALEKRMDAMDRRMGVVEKQMGRVSESMNSLQEEIGILTGIVRAVESQVESLEARHDDRIGELFNRIDTIDTDLKKFVKVVNEAVLHYAEEMDTIRDRVAAAEDKLGMSFPAD